jgi:Na+-driven multidrug efflux pump
MGMGLSLITGMIIISAADPLVTLFGLSSTEVFDLAVGIVRVSALRIALRMVVVVIFSSLRAGGDSKMLMMLDCGIVWLVGIPLIYGMIRVLHMHNFVIIYRLAQGELAVRILIGMRRFISNQWAINLTTEINEA